MSSAGTAAVAGRRDMPWTADGVLASISSASSDSSAKGSSYSSASDSSDIKVRNIEQMGVGKDRAGNLPPGSSESYH